MSSAHDGRRCRWDEGGKRWGKRQSFLETRASTRLCLRANTRLGEAGPVARILNLKRTLVSSGSEETCGIGRGDTHSFHFDAVILPSPNGICSVPHIPRSLPCHLQCRLPVLQIHGSHASTALGWVQLLGGGHLPHYLLGVPRHAPGHQVVNNAENQVQIFFTWGRLRCSRSSSPCSARKWPLSPHSPSSPGSPESECPKHFDPHTLTHPKSLGDGEALVTDDGEACLARGRQLKQIRFEICSKTTVFILIVNLANGGHSVPCDGNHLLEWSTLHNVYIGQFFPLDRAQWDILSNLATVLLLNLCLRTFSNALSVLVLNVPPIYSVSNFKDTTTCLFQQFTPNCCNISSKVNPHLDYSQLDYPQLDYP